MVVPTRIAVIETDGVIELADNLKVAYHGAGMTGLDVASNPLDEALLLPGVVAASWDRGRSPRTAEPAISAAFAVRACTRIAIARGPGSTTRPSTVRI